MPPKQTAKGRPSDETLDAWIAELFPEGKVPALSGEAKEYLESVLRDKIDKYVPTVSGWQYIATQLSAIAFDYALQREMTSNLMGEVSGIVEEKRIILARMREDLDKLETVELDETSSDLTEKQLSDKWDKRIEDLIESNPGGHKAVIKQGLIENREKSNQIKAMIRLTEKVGFDENLENLISRIEKIRNPKPEPLASPMPRLDQETPARARENSNRDPPKNTPHPQKRRSTSAGSPLLEPKNEDPLPEQKPITRSNVDLTTISRIDRLLACNIDYFHGVRDKAPYGEDFNMFLKLFERFANGVPDEVKLDELIKRLKGKAFEFLTNANHSDLNFTYDSLTKSLKAVFFKVETSQEKRLSYETLRQREDEVLEVFQIRFEHHFKEYYSLISGSNSSFLTDEVFKCNQFYTRVREVLRKQLEYRKQIILEEKGTLKWESLIRELRKIEKEFPANRRPDNRQNNNRNFQNSNQNQNQRQRGNFNQNQNQNRNNPNRQQYPQNQNRGNYQNNNNQSRGGYQNQQPNQANQAPPNQANKTRTCFKCNKEGHIAKNCQVAVSNPNFQPIGNNNNAPQRGFNRGRGGSNSNRGNRGNFRGNGRQGHMNMAQDAEYQQEDYYDNHISEDANTADSSLSYAEQLAQNFMGSQWDPDTEPVIHTVGRYERDLFAPEEEEEVIIPTFSLTAEKYKPTENPSWICKTAREDTIKRIKNYPGWAYEMFLQQRKTKRTSNEEKLLRSVYFNRMSCVDESRLVCPLIIEGTCIEDVIPDSGSQYNAISINALWALMGRFPRWEKAFEYATTWNVDQKTIQVAGGRELDVLGIIRLFVRVAGREIPIYWAIYVDEEPTIVLGTKGMRSIGMEMKSPLMGNINILVPKQDMTETLNRVYTASSTMVRMYSTPKTPTDVVMKSDQSTESPMEVVLSVRKPQRRSLWEEDMASLGLNDLCLSQGSSELTGLSSDGSRGSDPQPGTSYRMEAREQVFREHWDQ
jgi:hypothetical protein